jgi:hypothetical protein
MQLEAMAKEDEIELTGLAKEDKDKVDADIAKAKEELEASRKEFEKYTNIMMDTYKDTSAKLQSGPMGNDELEKTYDDYFATMYRFDWYIVPEVYDESVKAEKLLTEFARILNYLDNSQIKKVCGDITHEVIV